MSTHHYYGIAYGHKRGVYENFNEVRRFTRGFPHAVYKKFSAREAAEKFVAESEPQSVSLEADQTGDKFYALPRGKVIGIFKNYEDVKKNIHGTPKASALYKKFSTYDEAKAFFEQFRATHTEGEIPELPVTPKVSSSKAKASEPEANNTKQVARKRTTGKVGETDESEGEDLKRVETDGGGEDEDHDKSTNLDESTDLDKSAGADATIDEMVTDESSAMHTDDNETLPSEMKEGDTTAEATEHETANATNSVAQVDRKRAIAEVGDMDTSEGEDVKRAALDVGDKKEQEKDLGKSSVDGGSEMHTDDNGTTGPVPGEAKESEADVTEADIPKKM